MYSFASNEYSSIRSINRHITRTARWMTNSDYFNSFGAKFQTTFIDCFFIITNCRLERLLCNVERLNIKQGRSRWDGSLSRLIWIYAVCSPHPPPPPPPLLSPVAVKELSLHHARTPANISLTSVFLSIAYPWSVCKATHAWTPVHILIIFYFYCQRPVMVSGNLNRIVVLSVTKKIFPPAHHFLYKKYHASRKHAYIILTPLNPNFI